MGMKEDLWEAIDEELPETIANLIETTISVSSVTGPTTEEAAIIEQGKLAAKLNQLLDDLEGLSLVDLLLHVGQKSATSKLMFLSAIEAVENTGEDDTKKGFKILAPEAGKEYDAFIFPFSAERLDLKIAAITCALDDGQSVTLKREGNTFTGAPQTLMEAGQRTATFTADNQKTAAVSFTIKEFELITVPAEGETRPPIFQATVTGPADMTSARVTFKKQGTVINETPLILQKPIGGSVASSLIDLTGIEDIDTEELVDMAAEFVAELGGGKTLLKNLAFKIGKV
jgi:hypothetical protein